MTRRWLWIILTVAAVLRFAFIWRNPFWYDENFTLLLVRLPLDRMLAATAGDVHPPLFYLLLWPLGQIPGLPVWVLRIPSAMFSVLSVWLLYKIVSKTLAPKLQLVVLIIFALIPQQIYYAQEARMYALLTALLLGTWLAVLGQRWGWLFVLSLAMVYTHNYGLFYVASIWLAGMFYQRSNWKQLTLATALAGICWLPWAFVLAGQVAQISGNYWILPTTSGSALGDLAHMFFMLSSSWPANILNAAVFFGWLAFAVVTWRYVGLRKPHDFILAFGPWVIAAIVSALFRPVMLFRALVPCDGFLAIILAVPVGFLFEPGRRIQRLIAAVFIAPALLVNLTSYYIYPEYNKASTADVVRMETYVQDHARPGDLVYHTSDYTWVNVTPYATLPQYRMPSCAQSLGGLSLTTRAALGEQEIPLERLDYGRAWLLVLVTPYTPACEQSYLQPILAAADLVSCQRDDPLVQECLYLVSK
jgi:uncharacterized membrane protein